MSKKMEPELKVRWVEALKSGKYRFGRGCLRALNDQGELEYCPLGVLCEVVEGPEVWVHSWLGKYGWKTPDGRIETQMYADGPDGLIGYDANALAETNDDYVDNRFNDYWAAINWIERNL